MWDPSTSASVIIIILSYLSLLRSNSSPIPVPNAVIIVLISSFPKALSNLAFSTFNIFPLNGKIAWVIEFLPFLAEPPAESPSTINISDSDGSLLLQSDNFPKKFVIVKSVFLVASRAFLAAILAFLANIALLIIILAESGFSNKNCSNPSANTASAIGFTSELPSLPFVWPSNWGLGCLQDTIIVIPSFTSSSLKFSSFSFKIFDFLA